MSTRPIRLLAGSWLVLGAGCPSTPPFYQLGPAQPGLDVQLTSDDPAFGASLASADFDADGVLDVAISGQGVTWVCQGPLDSDRNGEACEGSLPGDHVAAGDLDADGVAELVTSTFSDPWNPVLSVRASPLQGAPALADITVLLSNIGAPRAAVADVSDSPGAELVVGAAGYDGLGPDTGSRLHVFDASALTGPLSSDDDAVTIEASFTADTFYNLELADTSGDGRPDLLTSFTGFNHGNKSYLLEAPLSASPDLEGSADVLFSWAHARFVGDLDGDGLTDVAVPAYESVRFWTGALTGPDPGEPDASLTTFETPQNLNPHPAGDMDGDGVQDVLIVDPVHFRTYLFFGPVEGDSEFDLVLALREDEILSFDHAIVLPDLDDNGTTELMLGGAHDLYGASTGTVWLTGLPWAPVEREE